MTRYMSGSQFGVKAAWRVGIFLALTLGFPFIVYGLVIASGADKVGGASGALAVVAGVFLKPLIVLAFLISLLSLCWKRMRSLGLPAPLGLLVPFLLLLDAPYLILAGAHWGVAFTLGAVMVSPPLFAMTAVAMMVAMALASPPPDGRTPGEHLGYALRAGAVLTGLLVVMTLIIAAMNVMALMLVWTFKPGMPSAPVLMKPLQFFQWLLVIKPVVCAAFCAGLAWLTVLSRRAGSGQAGGGGEAARQGPVLSPSPASAQVAFGKR